jgi:hypothetical protein
MDPTAHHIPASAQDQATRFALAQR